ncbi:MULTISPECIES: aminotransferase class I/II-fold pyridoxal phosphate-dependent enzyme [Thermoactinomyces]|jgi:arginine decarboxylase|uniref:Aminotransferase class I/II-fold pyridoxal phosphate-dependent enzyme n=1 Tax=Thermoactinomyces vulgaris TaxID=2026 RepID=A0ABS0QHY3_THEVU|nr:MULTISPECIES: aminotransferase class I/II-fold pyridoxal phosphate-dependent enzyme [Thermoactinomyces]KFZ40682.1 arginine decarboxylase [Thermoactinomyces sp. Gus2-1]KYQ86921.1 arginine decarboxylase [Thermoactinomyces sp. AS95]MBA4551714.1 aminotransferase class I/II-fold pyridoxal phosphate-dependent enzyme [Thermoactinomyces vulgaris]MBA4596407.1 aminotransferase class I/II-fold pyridoxal phosphate-dependent enzyme [Thermoactinomyces vulgaris]MBH8582862.1 aminotransferase class I/II-fol
MNQRQYQTPLFSKLIEHSQKNPLQFHIPGHKKGQGMDPEFRQFVGSNILSIDLINIEPLDDLHLPKGAIKEAQELAAEAFGADHTFFSVQGTSGAIMSMVMSVVHPGEKIIVPRNVHKSVITAIILAGAYPVFVHPEMDERLGIAHGITASQVQKALNRHPDAKAVLVINPTYYGIAGNLREIVEVVHRHGIPVLVDEAHGVLTHFHDRLPLSAMDAGADMAATSVHKLGGSLTQSSVLNLREGLVNPHRVQSIISMLTTTSTSYPLLASLDTARRYLAVNGSDIIEQTLYWADTARKRINEIPGLHCIGREWLGSDALYDIDETKLLIHLKHLGITGYDAEKWLREHHRIEVELSDLYNILCLVTPGDSEETILPLIDALQDLSDHFYQPGRSNHVPIQTPEIPELVLSPREAFYSPTVSVPLEEAAGRISAEFIMIYPPGIPVFAPGERITEENIDYIKEHIHAGLPVKGTEDPNVKMIRVIE